VEPEASPEFVAWALGFLLGFGVCWMGFESIIEYPDDDE
jgi:hypothetical protein